VNVVTRATTHLLKKRNKNASIPMLRRGARVRARGHGHEQGTLPNFGDINI
jgi:hypothetical protein